MDTNIVTIVGIVFGASGFWTFLQVCIVNMLQKKGKLRADLDEISKAVENLSTKIDRIEQQNLEQDAKTARARILAFNDELLNNIEHSKEAYDDALAYLDEYETYCDTHPSFINSRTKAAARNIKDSYKKHLENRDFLGLN